MAERKRATRFTRTENGYRADEEPGGDATGYGDRTNPRGNNATAVMSQVAARVQGDRVTDDPRRSNALGVLAGVRGRVEDRDMRGQVPGEAAGGGGESARGETETAERTPARGFDPGVEITRDLIRDNPDAALEHIHMLIEQSHQSGAMITDLQTKLAEADDTRHDLDRQIEATAAHERRAAELGNENQGLRTELADSHAQRTSLVTGQEEAMKAYRDLILQHNPQLPPSLISGGTLNDINASVEAARGVVAHVQANIDASNRGSRMPAGAPMRSVAPNPTTMTPTEKIVYGIRQERGEEMTG